MSLYDTDFFQWTQDTAANLRRSAFDRIDVAALAEEVEDMGKRDRRALESRVAILIAHLLKWDYQPHRQSVSWVATIKLQRLKVARLLADSPSLAPRLHAELQELYGEAKLLAVKQTRLPEHEFPESCPYSFEEILSDKPVCF